MATREYQTGESGFSTANLQDVLPDELSDRYFQNLDVAMQRIESTQMDRVLGGLADRGFLRSGDTFTEVSEKVLGPSMERRNQVLLPELRRAAGEGREERLAGVEFGRQKELAEIGQKYKLEQMKKQSEIQRMLLELEDSLQGGGGFNWEAFGGQVAGGLAGGLVGGFSGGAGALLAKKLFGTAAAGAASGVIQSYSVSPGGGYYGG